MIKGRAKYKSIQLSIKNYDKIVKKKQIEPDNTTNLLQGLGTSTLNLRMRVTQHLCKQSIY